jgi:hypothetical protein
MQKKIILICGYLAVLPHFIGSSEPTGARGGLKWEDYLPAIAAVESSNRVWARSWLGQEHGRGLYGISEICFEHWRWYHPEHWVVKQGLGPDCLYNTNVGREIALWYIKWLSAYYKEKPNRVQWVLSAYNQGPRHTDRHGLAVDYVDLVLAYFRK